MDDSLEGRRREEVLSAAAERGWVHDPLRDAIGKTYQFRNFVEAWGWMSRVALVAEKSSHHPEWRNVYGTVEVVLISHDIGGLSERDVRLAERMDRLLAEATS